MPKRLTDEGDTMFEAELLDPDFDQFDEDLDVVDALKTDLVDPELQSIYTGDQVQGYEG